MLPLDGITVLDFSTLLPGPMASLILAESGAEVIKFERPKTGDDMRHYPPMDGTDSANFKLLNRGKKSITIDLKDNASNKKLHPYIKKADIVIEQFRPGVMDRLGLGYDDMKIINPAIIYCAITGYGQTGPDAQKAGHDLNYIAASGLLGLSGNKTGVPVIPPALIADIGGGAYPAIMNILLALRTAEKTGEGQYLDIAMTDNMFSMMFWAQAQYQMTGENPKAGGELLSGGSPRYQIYETLDNRFLAAAPLEEKFWQTFCRIIGIEENLNATIDEIAKIIKSRTSKEWELLFEDQDACCSIVATLSEAMNASQFIARELFNTNTQGLTPLPTPLAPIFKRLMPSAPALGANND